MSQTEKRKGVVRYAQGTGKELQLEGEVAVKEKYHSYKPVTATVCF